MKIIINEEVVKEINSVDGLSASVDEEGLIEVEVLVNCGDALVHDKISALYDSRGLRFVRSDEAASVAWYEVDGGEIFEPVEGGVALFDSVYERDAWLNQI